MTNSQIAYIGYSSVGCLVNFCWRKIRYLRFCGKNAVNPAKIGKYLFQI